MSAYNAFFKDERVRLLCELEQNDDGGGKLGFQSMAKIIAQVRDHTFASFLRRSHA